jgi:alpha-ketoglutaric semialdehyde dehydrogenase
MHANFIAGEWVAGHAATMNINPSDTADVVGEFSAGTKGDVDAAVAAARSVFPKWSTMSIQLRHDSLKRIGDEIQARQVELGELLAREEGKTKAEGIGEAVRAAQVFHFFAGECLRIKGDKLASIREGVEIDVTREPLGVVGIITPWNFPIAIPAWKIAPALAYGNTVIFKPAELAPGCAHALADIIARSGIPDGVFNLVMGTGSTVGQAILDHEEIDGISFTGSVPTGRHVAQACMRGARLKKLQLELGGKSPLIVLDDADLDIAVNCAINGAFFQTGQRCTASTRLIVTEGIYDRFLSEMKRKMSSLVVGHALDSKTIIGPVASQDQLHKDLEYLKIGQQEGAVLAAGGNVLQRDTPGFYFEPTLFSEVSNTMRIAQEEIFGPIAALIRVKDYDDALQTANASIFGLSSGICTTSLKYSSHYRRHSASGMVMVNLPTAGVDYHVPFGGRKGSSYGPREQGSNAMEFYTSVKTAYVLP